MAYRFFLIAVLSILATAEVGVAGTMQSKERSGWHFSAENNGTYKRSKTPPAAIQIISRDDLIKPLLEGQDTPIEEVPQSWLYTTKVNLREGEEDIVVQGVGPVLGANVTTFWVFRIKGGSVNLLLEVHALDLRIGPHRKNGYLTIEALSATASSVTTLDFRMAGGEYLKYREHTEQLGGSPAAHQ